MGSIKFTLCSETLKQLNVLRSDFEKSRNLGGLLKIIAIESLAQGMSVSTIAELLGTCDETIRNWIRDFLSQGLSSFYYKKSPGRPGILEENEIHQLRETMQKSPHLSGFRGGCWDAKKVKQFIFQSFNKQISVKYIPELLKKIGFSFKKARVEISRRSDLADLRRQWVNEKWFKILDIADKQDAHVFFGDEAYFSIFGTSGYSWSLTNVETIIQSTGSKENLHVIGAINYFTGKIHALLTEDRVNADVFICFLRTLLTETRKPIHLIVDNAGYHKSAKVKEFLWKNRSRITIHYLPPYSPDFNPIESLWKKIKKETTHNVYFESIESLWVALVNALKMFRDEPSSVMSLFGFYEKLA